MRPLKLVPDNTNIRFLRWKWVALALSVTLLASSIGLVAMRGLNWGVDFVGGQQMRVSFAQSVDLGEFRARLSALDVGDVSIQQMADPKIMTVRIPLEGSGNPIGKCIGTGYAATAKADDSNKIASAVRAEIVKAYPGANVGSVNSVSGKVGCELFSTGSVALALAMAAIALFIWFRFEWQFGVGALVTLFHDVVLTFGFFAVTQLQFDLNVIAAILTIIGYSLNDTVVIFDRIREVLRKYKQMPIRDVINLATNQTLARTIMTSLTLLLSLGALYFFGGQVIRSFTAAMIWGVFVATASSIFIGGPLLIYFNLRADPTKPGPGPKEDEKLPAQA